jgi:exodeoxyribonuclease-3
MRLTTWNVNSIRSRLDRVVDWLRRRRPGVLALQETKVVDEAFPREAFEDLGYHIEVFGQKTYNGVALLSRDPLEDVVRGFGDDGDDEEKRLIAAVHRGVRVVCVYVPNGRSPDSPQFAHKLAWLRRLKEFLDAWASPEKPVVVMGDFNVAPDDRDVYDPEAWRGKVHFHPDEHAALAELEAWGLRDLLRVHEDAAGLYSWWDYRGVAFPRDAGLRLDLILGTPSAAARCTAVVMERDERKGEKPSDHIPVTAFLDEPPGF